MLNKSTTWTLEGALDKQTSTLEAFIINVDLKRKLNS